MSQPSTYRKKLIEVALPLDAINAASAREKSIRHGHPSTLHLWWARRPLAAARAVIFAQMVDDPSSHPELFPTSQEQEAERDRLFSIIEELVKWENTTNEKVIQQAREEIWKSWRRTCADNVEHSRAAELFNPQKLPAFHDPFAGGGALPLEAQRLGLEAHASDLNPVAVLINKAMIEIPPKFADQQPVNPESRQEQTLLKKEWRGARGLADDVRYYGKWMRDEAAKRIGHLYPKVEVKAEMATGRPDLEPYIGKKLTVIAWLWARTVKSPNPAFAEAVVPLASTFMLSTKKGKEAYVEPLIDGEKYRFIVKTGKPRDPEATKRGTRAGKAKDFICLLSGVPVPRTYIRDEGKAGRLGVRLMAVVAEGKKGRVYFSPKEADEVTAQRAAEFALVHDSRDTFLSGSLPSRAMMTGGVCSAYGLSTWGNLYTDRQLVALTTLADLVQGALRQVHRDALNNTTYDDGLSLNAGGAAATAYADAVALYLGMAVSRQSNRTATLNFWDTKGENIQQVFARQALPMTWDFVEGNPLSSSTGNFLGQLEYITNSVLRTPQYGFGSAVQQDAATADFHDKVVSTDPPYFDNISYAELSDFFYSWLRRSLKSVCPDIFTTVVVPKNEELVAIPSRHGGKQGAEQFFMDGVGRVMHRLVEQSHPHFPVTIYYAFKQSESDGAGDTASTGWERFLDAVIEAGFALSGTWPIRTEYTGNLKKNLGALASSIVLVCRPRRTDASDITRREFVKALKAELPAALAHLQHGSIAPVDLAQAAIGPGMSVYTRYSSVLSASGAPLSVREALALINQVLDEVLEEQEGEFDDDTRWAVTWFSQYGHAQGPFGDAEQLSKSKNVGVNGLVEAGILEAKSGKVRLLSRDELQKRWNPGTDRRLTVWEATQYLIRALVQEEGGGEEEAARLVAQLGEHAEVARDLAYRLYIICERNKWANEALAYNGLVIAWSEITRLAGQVGASPEQGALL